MPLGQPDHSHCLLQQKLQMINCCIERKLARENKNEGAKRLSSSAHASNLGDKMCVEDSETEDEFFECNEDSADEDSREAEKFNSSETSDRSKIPIWSRDAEGRQHRFGKLKLLEYDEWLYVPLCQDPTPMTEDMLAEQAEVYLIVILTDIFLPPPWSPYLQICGNAHLHLNIFD